MIAPSTPPRGPRGVVGASAEHAAARHLAALGWVILARNVRVGRDEIDIVAIDPVAPTSIVIVEVRSASTPRFGSPRESVDRRKVGRLYRAAMSLRRFGHPAVALGSGSKVWRVDLLTLTRNHDREWVVEDHLRGVEPP